MTPLRFRVPGTSQSLSAWIAQLLPQLDRQTRRAWIADGCFKIDGVAADRPGLEVPPGAEIQIEPPAAASFEAPFADAETSAPEWLALVDAPPWRRAQMTLPDGRILELSIEAEHASLARLRAEGAACTGSEFCEGLAALRRPAVGDLQRGGLGLPGGLRVASGSNWKAPGEALWPRSSGASPEPIAPWRWDYGSDPTAAVEELGGMAGRLVVSEETARVLSKGHPWIRPDAASDPAGRYAPGALVRVFDRKGGALGWAHVEATRRVAARMWQSGAQELREVPSIESRVARAIARRRPLLAMGGEGNPERTDAFRLIHGEGDDLPGLFVDCLGSLIRVLVSSEAALGIRDRVIAAMRMQLPVDGMGRPFSVLELLHLRSVPRTGPEVVRWHEGGPDQLALNGHEMREDGLVVWERGLRYAVDPGWATPQQVRPGYGLFVDQRENRRRLIESLTEGGTRPDGRWLNLFAHTGAFSVALLAAGVPGVISVDLSPLYLDRLDQNLELNRSYGVDPALHESRKGEARRALDEAGESFAGIVIDPPTAAAAGRNFWSVKEDLEPLLGAALDRLAEGGTLLVTQNRAGPPLGVDQVLARLSEKRGRRLRSLEPAQAGADHPERPGFPEGDPFEGWLATLA